MQTRYYQSYTDDFVTSRNQSYQLPDNYVWLHKNILYRAAARCFYLVGVIFSFCYCSFYLHIKVKNRSVLKKCRETGFFLYGNHTQPLGDAFIPARLLFPGRAFIVVGPANLGIPILGRLLPMLGALPVAPSLTGMKKLRQAVQRRIEDGNCVVIYPEAHVWPWYTGIRPFSPVSFSHPVNYAVPAVCMTATYQKRKFGRKPQMTIYLDGPFYPDPTRTKKAQKEQLRRQIFRRMTTRSQNSNYEYIRYEKGGS